MSTAEPLSKLVVARGGAMGLVVGMPAAFMNVVFASQTPKPQGAINLSFVLVLVSFLVAGFTAGLEAPSQATRHGLRSALVAFAPIELVAVLGRLDRGDPVAPVAIIVIGLLAAGAGAAGARLGAARRARRNPT